MPWVEEAPPGAPAITDGDGLIIGYAGSRYVWKDDAPASFAGQADPYTGVIVPEDVAARQYLLGAARGPGGYTPEQAIATWQANPELQRLVPDVAGEFLAYARGTWEKQQRIDAGEGDDFDFGNVIMAGLVAGVAALSGGFGLSQVFASPGAPSPSALEVLNTYPAEGALYEGVAYDWAGQADPYTGVIVPEDVAALPGASSSASAPIASTLGKLAPAGLGALLKNALAGDVQPIPTTAAEFSSLNAQQWLALGLMGAAAIGAVYLVTNE